MLKIIGCYIDYRGGRYTAQARSAELPFTGWAGFVPGYNPPGRFRELVRLAARYNLRVNTIARHTLDEVLSDFEEVHEEVPINNRRWVLQHIIQTDSEQMRRIKNLGLLVETIPLTELWLRGHRLVDDPQLHDTAVSHRSYLDEEVRFGIGTDNKPYNPFATLWSAVARTERRTGKVLGPDQRLNRMEALRVFTLGGRVLLLRRRPPRVLRNYLKI